MEYNEFYAAIVADTRGKMKDGMIFNVTFSLEADNRIYTILP